MNKRVKRIYIIGTSGSGKSYLAKQLSKKLNIPYYDLDDVFWYKKYTIKRSSSKRRQMLAKIASKNKWIIEGVYGSWIELALKKADLVILLDIHITKLALRILTRYIKRIGAKKETLKENINLIKYAYSYKHGVHTSSYKNHMALVKKHKLKYIILKNSKQVKLFLDKI